MFRAITSIIVVLIVGAGTVGALVWGLAFARAGSTSQIVRLPTLETAAQIRVDRDGATVLSAVSPGDLALSLGYYHGSEHTWSLALLRQTAVGRVAEWFGAEVVEVDVFVRQLGFDELAKRSLESLARPERELIERYAAGLRAALTTDRLAQTDELALFGVNPDPIEAWEVLAVERLLAWLSTSELDPGCLSSDNEPLVHFCSADRTLRSWLHLHGFEMSMAASSRDSVGTSYYVRQVYGSTALPLFAPLLLETPSGKVRVVSVIGVPMFPIIVGEQRSVLTLLTSNRTVIPQHSDSANVALDLDPAFSVVQTDDGSEILAVSTRGTGYVRLGGSKKPTPDSLANPGVLIDWSGFAAGSDIGRSWALLELASLSTSTARTKNLPPSSLFEVSGLAVDHYGVRILGTPSWQYARRAGILIGGDSLTHRALPRWLELVGQRPSPPPTLLFSDPVSPSDAAEWRAIVDAVGQTQLESLALKDAFAYLGNWDQAYDRSSIGASVFEMTRRLDTAPFHTPGVDTTDSPAFRIVSLFRNAVDTLVTHFGPDPTRWRWEAVQPSERYFPVWSSDIFADSPKGLGSSRYAPIRLDRIGHSETLAWGPALSDHRLPAPAAIEIWGYTHAPDSVSFRADLISRRGFLSRYMNRDVVDPIRFDGSETDVDLEILLKPDLP